MGRHTLWFVALGLAGLLECGMAVAHFGLQYEWYRFGDFRAWPAYLAWALFALNFSWSVLLLGVGGLVLYAARLTSDGAFMRTAVFVVGLFWAIHGLYVWLVPMPLPNRLLWLRVPLVVFPAVVVALHWAPLFATRSRSVTRLSTAAAPV
jgi:hypothetical protein